MTYKLISKRNVTEFPVLKMSVAHRGTEKTIYIINGEAAEYILIPKLGCRSLVIKSDDLVIERLSPLQSVRERLAGAATRKRKKFFDFPGFKLLFGGPYETRRLFFRTNRLLARLQSRPDGKAVQLYPELLIGWGKGGVRLAQCAVPRTPPIPIAIVYHLYYPETWPEFAEVLRHIPYAFDLFVTTVPERSELAAQIQAEFPTAQVRIVENCGRDVRPFLLLLEEGALAPYEIVCKIHGKRSIANDPSGNLGDICRRRALFDMLVGPGCLKAVIDRFRADPSLGIMGSRNFRLNKGRDRNIFWRGNEDEMKRLISELGGDQEQITPDFFEGTMFWVRPAALESLRRLNTTERFAVERGAVDGALEHAIERIFAVAVKVAGFRIDDIDGLSGS